jgi:hypothetical protein
VLTLPGASVILSKPKKQQKGKKQSSLTYEDYLDQQESYKSKKEHLKKQKNHLSRYVQELKDNREEHKTINDKENALEHRWIQVTKSFTQEAFGRSYRVQGLTLGSRQIVAICSHRFDNLRGSNNYTFGTENKYKKGENKFRGGDHIIKKLLFLAKHHPD